MVKVFARPKNYPPKADGSKQRRNLNMSLRADRWTDLALSAQTKPKG
jgi:hypothetical protein